MKRLQNSLKATAALSLLNFLGKRKKLKTNQTKQNHNKKSICYVDGCVGNIMNRTAWHIPKFKAAGNKER